MGRNIAVAFFCFISLTMVSHGICGSDWESKTKDEKPKDVVDYFLRLPVCRFDEERDTIDVFNSRKECLEVGATREVTVDIANGYLRIRDNEFLLEKRLTVCYFKRSDGRAVIGFSEYYEGGDCDDYMITFYTYGEGTWNDVTVKVFPTILIKDFWSKDTTFSIEKHMSLDECLNWYYVLPRFGSKMSVLPVAKNMFLCFDLESYDREFVYGSNPDSLLMEYFKIVEGRDYHSIDLWWSQEKGIFEIGKKIINKQ